MSAHFTTYDVIYSFRTREQEHGPLRFNKSALLVTERDVLRSVFKDLHREDPDKLSDLIKLSLCQMYTSEWEDLPEWMRATDGKVFFNDDRNRDADTRRLATMKRDYVRTRGRHW